MKPLAVFLLLPLLLSGAVAPRPADGPDQPNILFDLAFAKRPAEELYDLKQDPDQLHNVAADPAYTQIKKTLWNQLMGTLQATGDPRVRGQGDLFDLQPYSGGIVRARGM